MLIPTESKKTIRFQVVVWYIGKNNMVQGRVPMTFCVTLFWSDRSDETLMTSGVDDSMETASFSSKGSAAVWQMQGRQRAFQQETKEAHSHAMAREVPVPAISTLNIVSFDIVGSPEVSVLREDTKLMRWTCMYKAMLIQEHWRVDSFPHDNHDNYPQAGHFVACQDSRGIATLGTSHWRPNKTVRDPREYRTGWSWNDTRIHV